MFKEAVAGIALGTVILHEALKVRTLSATIHCHSYYLRPKEYFIGHILIMYNIAGAM